MKSSNTIENQKLSYQCNIWIVTCLQCKKRSVLQTLLSQYGHFWCSVDTTVLQLVYNSTAYSEDLQK